MVHAKFLSENANWDIETAICLSVNFTPGSVSLASYKLNLAGYEWLKNNKDTNPNPSLFTQAYYEKSQLLLSERFMGFFMIPDNMMWNYNFVGLGVVSNIKYAIVPGNPK